MKNFVAKLSAFVIVCLALVASLPAQNTSGTISGTVRDKTGAVIPNVSVIATNEATNVTNTVSTNESGAYSFLSLPVGTYNVEAKQTGFTNYKQTGIALNVNDHITVDIAMEVGAVTQTVEVSANAAHVETSSATLGDVIGGKSIVDQPLVSRSYIDLMGLQAGVNPSTNGSTGSQSVSGNLSPGNVSVSGSRADANGFTVNGGNVEESEGNGTSIIPNADAIAEFRIITNSANAEYGHYSGGAVSVITKSGTNSFHGDAFEFWRNENMDAIQPFSNTKGAYSQNQFGGTIGGPIKRNRLFFFGDYQGTKESTGTVDTVNVLADGSVPGTSNELAGNLLDRTGLTSNPYNDFSGSVSSAAWAGVLASRLGYAVTDGEPYYLNGCASSTLCVFPNAIIPKSAWAAPAVQLLKFVPPANGVQNGLPIFQTTTAKSTLKDNKGSARVDATTGIGQLSFYYFLDNAATVNPYGGGDLPGFATQTPSRAQQFNFGDVKTIGGSQLNDFKLNYTRTHHFSGEAIGGIGPSFASLGFVAGGNGLVAVDPAFQGVPQFSTNEFSGGESGAQTAQTDNTYQFNDAYSIIHGTHQFKFGGEANYVEVIERRIQTPNGQFQFNGTETGDDLADFLIGSVDTFTQSSNQVLDSRAWYYGAFAQDTWRIKPSLTINYGLRQDVSTFWYDTQNKIQAIVPGLSSSVYPGAPTGWVFPGDPGVPRTLAPTHYNNFAPRFAFAYSPNFTDGALGKMFGPSGHTAIRGAWGIFYTVVDDGTLFTEVADAPFGLYWQVPGVEFATPWVKTSDGLSYGQHFPFTIPPPGDKNIDWSFFEPIASSPGVAITDRLPYTEEYNFTIERQINSSTTATVAYVGSQGHRLPAAVEANPGLPSLCSYLSVKANVQPGTQTCGPSKENDVFTLPNSAGTKCNVNSPAGFPCVFGTRAPLGINFGAGDQYYTTVGRANYSSLQASLRHTGKRYTFLAAYTWSKSMDTGSALGTALDPLPNPSPALPNPLPSTFFTPSPATVTTFGAPDYNHYWSLSSFDLPQNFVASYSYNLPFDKLTSRFSRLTNGWVVAGTTRFATGTPIGVSYSTDNSYIGTFGVDVPNYNGGNVSHLNPRTSGNFWINCPKTSKTCATGVYSAEPAGQIGNAMRDFIIGPGWNNTDISLEKGIAITGERQVQIRIDAFNVFNHTQYNNPSGSFTSGNFMKVTSARPARIAQLGVKFVF